MAKPVFMNSGMTTSIAHGLNNSPYQENVIVEPCMRILISILISLTFCSCNDIQPDKRAKIPAKLVSVDTFYIDSSEITSTYIQYPDTANQMIYDFMAVVINNKKLNLKYGLLIDPSQDFSLEYKDKEFLETLLEKKEPPVKTNTRSIPIEFTFDPYDKCLTRMDIDQMLRQKEINKNIRWSNSRLGFDLTNHKNFYCFSVPVFSLDKKKAIVKISDLCPGLCGTSETVLFKKENGKWISQSGFAALH